MGWGEADSRPFPLDVRSKALCLSPSGDRHHAHPSPLQPGSPHLLETLSFPDSPSQSSVTLGKGPSSPQAQLPPPGHHQGEKQGKAPSKKLPQKRESLTQQTAQDSLQPVAPRGLRPPSIPLGAPPRLLSCRVLGDPALARVWSAGPWPRPSSARSLAGIQGEITSSRGQEGPPGLDRRAQQAGPDRRGGDGGLPASLTALALSSRARSCPRLSTNQEGPLSPGGSSPGVGKDEVSGELSRVPGNHQRLLPVSPWPESRVTRESWRGSRSGHSG